MKNFFKNIQQVCLILVDFNQLTGFTFELLHFDYAGEKGGFVGSLLGCSIGYGKYFNVYLFFIQFEIKSPFVK